MTTLTASQLRIPPQQFNQVVYQQGTIKVEHRNGSCAYVIGPDDWDLLDRAKQRRRAAIRAASQRVGDRHHDLMKRLAE